MNKKYIAIGIVLGLGIVALVTYFNRSKVLQYVMQPTDSRLETATFPNDAEEIVAENLTVPWEIVILPDNTLLVTERSGNLKHIDSGTVIPVDGVVHKGEGGLLGMALHPNFKKNNYLYLYYTTNVGGTVTNRVERYQYKNETISNKTTIIDNIPGSSNHDGGRIAFGPDGLLYIATGDAQNDDNAQDKNILAGKILRVKDDGTIPSDNPFNNAVYSYGHRNPQGLAWDSAGRLWATEHGRSGIKSGFDELNLITKGANYGWPILEGPATQNGFTAPILYSDDEETWAPSGLAYHNGMLIFSGLRGQSLYATPVSDTGEVGTLTAYLKNKYGRLRAVVSAPDGSLYISTSNTDGRGQVKDGDDKIIRLKSTFKSN